MNAQPTTSISDLTDLINANVKETERRIAEQAKVVEAAKVARTTKEVLMRQNEIRKSEANVLVSEIQTKLAAQLKDVDKDVQAAYKAELIRLGVQKPEAYPLITAIATLDKVATKGLGFFGKVIKSGQDVYGYAKSKVEAGMK